jgi:predicted acyltransferase (DUF342 family)
MKLHARALSAFAVCCLAFAPPMASAREQETVSHRLGDDVFMAGGHLQMSEAIPGDAILAGGTISTSGAVRGDQVAAGGRLDLGSNVDGGLYAAGGRVLLEGKVGRNARIAGGDVEIGAEADVQGGVTVCGGRVEINGHVGKYLQVGAGRTRIDGHIGGDVHVASGELSVGPGAIIDGMLTYYGPQPATVAAGAQIKGGLQYVERKRWAHGVHTAMPRGLGVGAWLWLIGWIVAGSVLLALWPGFTRAVTDAALRRPWIALLTGFVVLVCAPIAVLLLMITVIGIPLALLAICLYVALLPLGYLASAATIGEWVLSRMRQGAEIVMRQRILMLIGVLVVLFVLSRVPWLGGVVKSLAVLVGVGGLVMAAAARHRTA